MVASIMKSVESNVSECINPNDFYCMMHFQVHDKFDLVVNRLLKSCEVWVPKVSNVIQDFHENDENWEDFTGMLRMRLGRNQVINQEYFIYEPLNLVGTVGGTLGLFLGFSFYDFFAMNIDWVLDFCKIK